MVQTSLDELLHEHSSALSSLKTRFPTVDDEVVLLRYLLGYGQDVDKAAQVLETTLAWRKENNLDQIAAIIRDESIAECDRGQFAWPHAQLIFGFLPQAVHLGFARDGTPVSVEKTGLVDPSGMLINVSEEEFQLYHMFHMEYKWHMVNRLSREQNRLLGCTKIMDLQGLSTKQLHRKGIAFLRKVLHISQAYYPEMLTRCVIVNAPTSFDLLWRVVRPMLHQRTRDKVQVKKKDFQTTLHEFVDPVILPDWLHGTCEVDPLSSWSAVRSSDLKLAQVSRGGEFSHSVQLSKGQEARWRFRTRDKDISFGVDWNDTQHQQQERVSSHEKHCQGSFFASDDGGTLVLRWDNSFSRWTAKDLFWRVQVLNKIAD